MTILLYYSQLSGLYHLDWILWLLLYIAGWEEFLLDSFLALHQVLLNVTTGSIMILAFLAQVHQHLSTVCVCICRSIESLICCWVLVYTLVYWTIDSSTLSLSVGLEFTFGLWNKRLIELFSILSCNSVLNNTFSLIWYRMWLRLSSTILFYRFGQKENRDC